MTVQNHTRDTGRVNNSTAPDHLQTHAIPGHVEILTGNGGLPKILLRTKWSVAEIYLHGAHLTKFQKNGEPPLLWMSDKSNFAVDKPIRGGVPICFPWFGPRENRPAHGFARLTAWHLAKTARFADGRIGAHFHLPKDVAGRNGFPGNVELVVILNETLTMELTVANPTTEPVSFENCLHTYFTIGDINKISITGLNGANYLDKVDGGLEKRGMSEAIHIASEVDRVFPNSTGAVEIHDSNLRRVIRVEKSGSFSTVVWNPWIAKSRAMPDFGDEEFKQMICVESGNVGQNKIILPPGGSATLKVVLSSRPPANA